MIFLLISQRGKANNSYSLKDLEGHGRIDVVFRCILAAGQQLVDDEGHLIYCFLKGTTPHGWLKIPPHYIDEQDDEVSLAAKVKEDWTQLFFQGELTSMVKQLQRPFTLLTEQGNGTLFGGHQSSGSISQSCS